MIFASFQEFEKCEPNTVIKQMSQMYQWSSWKMPEAFIWNAINSTGLLQFQ
jgi:hypothetical protein